MVVSSACGAGRGRLDDLTPRALPARTQVQVWQGEQPTLLHGVTLASDTLRGVPFTQPRRATERLADADERVYAPLIGVGWDVRQNYYFRRLRGQCFLVLVEDLSI